MTVLAPIDIPQPPAEHAEPILSDVPLPDGVTVHLLADLAADPEVMRPRVPIIPRLAYPGLVSVLAGGHKLGKSTLLREAVARSSSGRAFLGDGCAPATTLWVALDEPLGDAARGLLAARADPARVLLVEPPCSLPQLVQVAHSQSPQILVLDTLSDLAAAAGLESENDALPVKRLLAPLRQLARERELAVIVVHHSRKSDGAARGSGAIGDTADLLLTMSEDRDDTSARLLKVRGRVPVRDFRVRWGEDGFELADDEPDLEQLVLMAIWAMPGCTASDVRSKVARKKLDVTTTLQRLKAAGQVIDKGSGNRSALFVAKEMG